MSRSFAPGYPKMIYKSSLPTKFGDYKQVEVALEGKTIQTRVAKSADEETTLEAEGWTTWLEDFIEGAVRPKQPEDILAEEKKSKDQAIERADAAEAALADAKAKIEALEKAAADAEAAAGRRRKAD
jgi:hypothetical protein